MSPDTAMDFYVDALARISAGEYDQMYMWKLLVFDGIMDFPVDLNYGYAKLNEWLNSSNVKIRATAMAIVGMFYFEGKYGMQQDYKRAFMHEKQAEELASVGEPYILGYCYLYGLGTKKDLAKAKSYILQSAKEGIEPAIAIKKKKGW